MRHVDDLAGRTPDKRLIPLFGEVFWAKRISDREWHDCKYCGHETPTFRLIEGKMGSERAIQALRCCWECGNGLEMLPLTVRSAADEEKVAGRPVDEHPESDQAEGDGEDGGDAQHADDHASPEVGLWIGSDSGTKVRAQLTPAAAVKEPYAPPGLYFSERELWTDPEPKQPEVRAVLLRVNRLRDALREARRG